MNTPTKPVEQKAREMPMVDIEERLRDVRMAQAAMCLHQTGYHDLGEFLDDAAPEAADEIARLKAEIAALNTDEERIRRDAFEEAAKVADNLDAGVVAYHIRSLSTPSKGVG